jgi:hypothetical protein
MRTIFLGGIASGIAIGLLAGTAILSSETAEAQYSTQRGQGWVAKAIRGQKGPAGNNATKQTKQSKSK